MPESKLPYLTAYGNISKALEKIKQAQTPDRFSQDFLETTLGMSGGGARPVVPYLKRTGFLNPDGTPTDLYKRFRNPDLTGGAAAEAMRIGYARLFEMDENVHKRDAAKLKNLVVQATGFDSDAPTVYSTVKSFEALNGYAKFSELPKDSSTDEDDGEEETMEDEDSGAGGGYGLGRINLGYTINLNLPATSDVGVYNAIFRSLRENLLKDQG
jgi:hypothetical protein